MYSVIWKPLAEQQLARIWIDNPPIRERLMELVREAVEQLKQNPATAGEGRAGVTRVLIVEYLVLFFDVIADDSRVEVMAVRAVV